MKNFKFKKSWVQFTQFSMIGSMNGALDLVALNLLLQLWQDRSLFALFMINTAAYSLAVLNSYLWNSRLTFRWEALANGKEKMLFALQALISLLISNGIFLLFNYGLAFLPIPLWIVHNAAKLISMALSSISSFFFMKYFVFRNSGEISPQ